MQFLEQDQSNTRLYISYAMALNKLEGYKSAKKVFDLAFEGRKEKKSAEGFNDLFLLYVHAAKLELKQGRLLLFLVLFSRIFSNISDSKSLGTMFELNGQTLYTSLIIGRS